MMDLASKVCFKLQHTAYNLYYKFSNHPLVILMPSILNFIINWLIYEHPINQAYPEERLFDLDPFIEIAWPILLECIDDLDSSHKKLILKLGLENQPFTATSPSTRCFEFREFSTKIITYCEPVLYRFTQPTEKWVRKIAYLFTNEAGLQMGLRRYGWLLSAVLLQDRLMVLLKLWNIISDPNPESDKQWFFMWRIIIVLFTFISLSVHLH